MHSLMPKSSIPWHKDTDNPDEFSRGIMLPIIIPKNSYIEFEDGSKDTYDMGYCYNTRFGVRHRVINASNQIRVMCMITTPPFVTFYKNYDRKTELNTMWGWLLKMMIEGVLFFGFIILSYGVGVWVGTKIKQPKIIIKNPNTRRR